MKVTLLTTALLLTASLAAQPVASQVPDVPRALGPLAALTNYHIVLVDVDAAREQVAAGEPVTLDFGDKSFTVQLEYHHMRSRDWRAGWTDTNGTFHRVDVPRAYTYRGDALDEAGQPLTHETEARVQLLPDSLRASVIAPEGVYYLEPLGAPSTDGLVPHVAYRSDDHKPWDIVDVEVLPEGGTSHPEAVEGDEPLLVASAAASLPYDLKLVAAADPEYLNDLHGGNMVNAANRIDFDVSLVEALYQNQFSGLTFTIVMTVFLTTDQSGDGSTEPGTKLADYRNHVYAVQNAQAWPDWNLAHMWSGMDLCSTGPSGCWVLGSAWRVGDYALSTSFSVTQHKTDGTMNYWATDHQQKAILSHEMGHLFGGEHCDAAYEWQGLVKYKTIMMVWNTVKDEERTRMGARCDDVDAFNINNPYVERFSDGGLGDGASNNNLASMKAIMDARFPGPARPSSATGPSSGLTEDIISFTFPFPTIDCYWIQVDWGDGTPLSRPSEADLQCSNPTWGHVYANEGSYTIKHRVKRFIQGTWSDWSIGKGVTITCKFNDPGTGCDAADSFSGAALVSPGTFQGFIRPGDTGDQYQFSVAAGQTIRVTLQPPSCQDYNVGLFNPSGVFSKGSTVFGCDLDTVELAVTQAGNWRIRVYPASFQGNPSTSPYTVTLTLDAANQPPTVNIDLPTPGATVSGLVDIRGTASDPDGTVQRVEVRIDAGSWQTASGTTSWGRLWDTTFISNGEHTIRARSWDGTAFSSEDVHTVFVSNGGGGGGSIIRRDDDGTAESQVDMNQGDDEAVKRLVLQAGDLSGATSAKLWVFAAADQCSGSTGTPYDFIVGSWSTQFNPCTVWTPGPTKAWKSLDVPLSALQAGTTNTFRIEDARSNYLSANLYAGIDTTNDFGRSDIIDSCCGSKPGELMWYLEIACSPCSGGTIIWSDKMEGGINGWTTTIGAMWHQTERRANSPTHSWWYGQEATGDYDNGVANAGSLTSPWISLPAGSGPQLKFQSWYETEDTGTSWDTKKVYVTTDEFSWTQIHQVSGTNRAWTLQTVDLSSRAGQTIKLRFEFNTVDSASNNLEGWFIDDVQVTSS